MGFRPENWERTRDFLLAITFSLAKVPLVSFYDAYTREFDNALMGVSRQSALDAEVDNLSALTPLLIPLVQLASVLLLKLYFESQAFKYGFKSEKSVAEMEKNRIIEEMTTGSACYGVSYNIASDKYIDASSVLRSDLGDSLSSLFQLVVQRFAVLCDLVASMYALWLMPSRLILFGLAMPALLIGTLAVIQCFKMAMAIPSDNLRKVCADLRIYRDQMSKKVSHLHENAEKINMLDGAKRDKELLVQGSEEQKNLLIDNASLFGIVDLGKKISKREYAFFLGTLVYLFGTPIRAMSPGTMYIACSHFWMVTRCFSFIEEELRRIAWLKDCFKRSELLVENYKSSQVPGEMSNLNVSEGKGLSFNGTIKTPEQKTLFEGSFELISGKIHWLKGGNGLGKSTIIRAVNKMCSGAEGDLVLPKKMITLSQHPYIRPGEYTLVECILDLKRGAQVDESTVKKIKALLRKFKLEHVDVESIDSTVSSWTTLSGGEKQCICLVRAIMREPDLLILDEPFSALSPANKDVARELLKEKPQGTTLLYTSQETGEEELGLYDVRLHLKDRKITVYTIP